MPVYGRCKNKTLKPVYTQDEMDEMMEEKQNQILYGSDDPTDDIGVDGDIYIKTE